jgi:hypothetical protein
VFIRGWAGSASNIPFKKTPATFGGFDNATSFFFHVSINTDEASRQGGWVSGQGAVVADEKGNVLGLVGTFYSALTPIFGYAGMIAPVVDIDSALELLAPDVASQPWANGPAFSLITTTESVSGHAPSHPPMSAYDEMAEDIWALLGTLGSRWRPTSYRILTLVLPGVLRSLRMVFY